jgi:RHH-type transcriptional regulator, proline utilization regulon repressor / proline dehydrogenase / delta 1-pyrroline-5-carboxylate dehydrogenase
VSVKISGITAQLNRWDFEGSLARVERNLARVFRRAADSSPRTFVNVDMEAYEDFELSLEAFTSVLGRDEFAGLDAGIAVQAYLPDALPALQRLVEWSNARQGRGGGRIRVRLVKGANLTMEAVEAEMRGWTQAPYGSKAETDANWLRCVDWMMEVPERTQSVRLGIASHNLFDVAYARLRSVRAGVEGRIQFEMLHGMTPAQASVVRAASGNGLLLYTPIVEERNFDTAVAYLFRRLEENASDDNFLRSLFTMRPGSASFEVEAARFRASVARLRGGPPLWTGPRRRQARPAACAHSSMERDRGRERGQEKGGAGFIVEPDTDPSLPANRRWAVAALDASRFVPVQTGGVAALVDIDRDAPSAAGGAAGRAAPHWRRAGAAPRGSDQRDGG